MYLATTSSLIDDKLFRTLRKLIDDSDLGYYDRFKLGLTAFRMARKAKTNA